MWMSNYFKLFYYFSIVLSLLIEIKTDPDNEEIPTYEGPVPLSIYLDPFNFEEKIPPSLENSKDIFIEAMNNAKDVLEKIFLIEADPAGIIMTDYRESWGISKWNETMFKNNASLYLKDYNIFIFFKFSNLNNIDMTSKIIITYANDMPLMGLVTINENIDNSKLKVDYLTALFL